MDKEIIQALAVTAEITGTEISPAAARAMAFDLAIYPKESVLKALTRCRRECKGRLTLADIISRLDDGRPGPEEAWAMLPKSERDSAVMTEEMSAAYAVCQDLIDAGELIQARMAFKEKYLAEVQNARDERKPVKWFPSLGDDKLGRDAVIRDAIDKGRLSQDYSKNLIENNQLAIGLDDIINGINKRLDGPKVSPEKLDKYREQLKQMVRR